jgi:hypothetical protein
VLTIHHWVEPFRGLAELMRVCRSRIVILTCDMTIFLSFWMLRYLPEVAHIDEPRFVPIPRLAAFFPRARVEEVPIPHDCTDGFFGAYWKRPSAYLRADVRRGISVLGQLNPAVVARALAKLERELETGAWAEETGRHLPGEMLDLGYRLVVGELKI